MGPAGAVTTVGDEGEVVTGVIDEGIPSELGVAG